MTKSIFIIFLILTFKTYSQQAGSIKDKRKGENISYKTVLINGQTWMAENLNASRFRNGDIIKEAKTNEEWINAAINNIPAWCYYENNSVNGSKYGKLYNWHAIKDPRGITPEGWKVPKTCDVLNIYKSLKDGKNNIGKYMKSLTGWDESGNGENYNGFNALPGGFRKCDVQNNNSYFGGLSHNSSFWTSEIEGDPTGCFTYDENSSNPYYFFLTSVNDQITFYTNCRFCGFSVRCIKN
jgi:uncharacterized protein (TIGR02145 family)